ncbi:hypothetical protein [Rhodoblastus acidophilus]|nr:hypothetical protein [Rhodoblastus acidophilus]
MAAVPTRTGLPGLQAATAVRLTVFRNRTSSDIVERLGGSAMSDKRIVDHVNDMYLAVWDLTGATVGDCLTVIDLVALVVLFPTTTIGWILFFCVFAIDRAFDFIQRKNLSYWNVNAEWFRSMSGLRYVMIALAIVDGLSRGRLEFVIGCVLTQYLFCCRVRERDPDRFKKRKLASNLA